MEMVHGTSKAFKFVSEDVISNMPDDIITSILDRLPIQDVARTSILSRSWRHKWTMLSQVIFGTDFFRYLTDKGGIKCYVKIISRHLLRLKGVIKKFELYIHSQCYPLLDAEDVNSWIMSLSNKQIKEITILHEDETPITLPTHFFSFRELKHLKLEGCCFPSMPSFHGFPNLLSLDLYDVRSESYKCGEVLTLSPLLEILKIRYDNPTWKLKQVDITNLENLKVLSLPLCKLDDMALITSSSIFQLVGHLSKLQKLKLDFINCKLFADAREKFSTALPSIKTLTLYNIDFNDGVMVSCILKFIWGFPNLQNLKIQASFEHDNVLVPAPSEVECSRMRQLQLRNVAFKNIRCLDNEILIIKTLLASSPFLKKMSIRGNSQYVPGGKRGGELFDKKLLKLHRASPIAEIDLYIC